MTLQEYLVRKFSEWSPPAPVVVTTTKYSVTLEWAQVEPFQFIADQLLYRLEKDEKIPTWVVVYSGGKTKKEIDNLPPRHPHNFRLKVIVQAAAVQTLADRAVLHYGSEVAVYEAINRSEVDEVQRDGDDTVTTGNTDVESQGMTKVEIVVEEKHTLNTNVKVDTVGITRTTSSDKGVSRKWLESAWSQETWTSTDTDGTSIRCFCMAVRCGYIKQVQSLLEERPELISIVNPTNGFTALATAVRQGDVNAVRFLVGAGALLDQPSSTGQTPLHLAVLTRCLPIVDFLIEKGADFNVRDVNGLRVEHYAVDSCDVRVLRHILDRGGDVTAQDNNGWTPLFRALCQGADTAMIEELVVRGSELEIADKAGLPLTSVARIMTNRQGQSRESVLRLVDARYPREAALAHFTRLTKKIYNVHTLFKLPALTNKPKL